MNYTAVSTLTGRIQRWRVLVLGFVWQRISAFQKDISDMRTGWRPERDWPRLFALLWIVVTHFIAGTFALYYYRQIYRPDQMRRARAKYFASRVSKVAASALPPSSLSTPSDGSADEIHEVCIVGTSPSGCACAYYLSLAGKGVLLLDRKLAAQAHFTPSDPAPAAASIPTAADAAAAATVAVTSATPSAFINQTSLEASMYASDADTVASRDSARRQTESAAAAATATAQSSTSGARRHLSFATTTVAPVTLASLPALNLSDIAQERQPNVSPHTEEGSANTTTPTHTQQLLQHSRQTQPDTNTSQTVPKPLQRSAAAPLASVVRTSLTAVPMASLSFPNTATSSLHAASASLPHATQAELVLESPEARQVSSERTAALMAAAVAAVAAVPSSHAVSSSSLTDSDDSSPLSAGILAAAAADPRSSLATNPTSAAVAQPVVHDGGHALHSGSVTPPPPLPPRSHSTHTAALPGYIGASPPPSPTRSLYPVTHHYASSSSASATPSAVLSATATPATSSLSLNPAAAAASSSSSSSSFSVLSPSFQAEVRALGVGNYLSAAAQSGGLYWMNTGGMISPSGDSFVGAAAALAQGRFQVVHRPLLHRCLASAAISAGTLLRGGTQVVDLKWDEARKLWYVFCLDTQTKQTYTERARAVVLADGAESHLARGLGVVLQQPDSVLLVASLRLDTTALPDSLFLFLPAFFPGYVALYRCGPSLLNLHYFRNVGAATNFDSLPNASTLTQQLLQAPQIRSLLRGDVEVLNARTELRRTGGVEKSYGTALLLVGGAAGQCDPFSGMSNRYGLLGARCAAKTLLKAFAVGDLSASFLSEYQVRWQREVGYTWSWSALCAAVCYRFPVLIDAITLLIQRRGGHYLAAWALALSGERRWNWFLQGPYMLSSLAFYALASLLRRSQTVASRV